MPPQALVDFKLFAAQWNRAQNQATPALHFHMIEWLESAWKTGDRHLLLQAFRGSGKSTLAGLFAAWLLYRQPDLRVLVLAADSVLAAKMVRNVRRILERHMLTAHLRPRRPDQWAGDRFTVRRGLELRDPSMLGRGITGNITGSRADVIICDDVEVPNTCDTAEKRENLRERLAETDFILTPGGTQLYIGTPHTYYTIYAQHPRAETGEERAFLEEFSRLSLPLIDKIGLSAWPERFSDQDIERIRLRAGPYRFASQMMLVPMNIEQGRLDPALLQRYDDELHMSDELKGLYLGARRMLSASAWWDPAFGTGGGDSSVLAVVFTDDRGMHFLHRIVYIKAKGGALESEAEQQCRVVTQCVKALYLPFVAIETNGIGKFLPAVLRKELARARLTCAVLEKTSTRPKALRILEALDAVLAARFLHAHESVHQTPFIVEMQEWRPGKSGGRDDGLDAVAGALSLEPVRIARVYPPGKGQTWRGGADVFTAKTEFEV